MWYRVFGTNEVNPEPAALLEHLQKLGLDMTAQFGGDDQGWFRARFTLADPSATVPLERYLATEEGIRHELNTWVAWLETLEGDPNQGQFLRHVAGATQLFTLEQNADLEDPEEVEQLCLGLCRFLARETAGVYQVDNQGFFSPDGTILLRE